MHEVVPQRLVAVAVTIVVPFVNTEPDAGEYEIEGDGLPVAVAALDPLKVTIALQSPGSLFTVIFAGQVITGAVLTIKVTAVEVILDPQASVIMTS